MVHRNGLYYAVRRCRHMRLSQENRNELKLGRLLSTEKPKNAPKTLEKDLKWTQREEAPRWMQMMAPYKGATAPPNRLEAIILSIVFVAGYYSWFVDPGSFLVNSKNDTHQTEGDEEH